MSQKILQDEIRQSTKNPIQSFFWREPKGKELTENQKLENKRISSFRVYRETRFRRGQKYRIVKER